MLRRTLDFSFPNQRAEVFITDASGGEMKEADWKSAGVWYLAGGNACVFSRSKDERRATLHIVQASHRRFRYDAFCFVMPDFTPGDSE